MTSITSLTITESNQHFDYNELKALLHTELKFIDNTYYCTIRGLSRLLGVSPGTLTDKRLLANGQPHGLLCKLRDCSLQELPNSLKPLQGFDYTRQASEHGSCADKLLPDMVVAAVIKYYANDARVKKQRAIALDAIFTSIGVRELFARVLNSTQKAHPVVTNSDLSVQRQDKSLSYHESQTTRPTLESRAAIIHDFMQLFKFASDEFKEKALLTFLDII